MFIICQYFSHRDPARAAEFEFCIRDNIKNGHQVILFEEQPAPDDIRQSARLCIEYPQRLTYAHALDWANKNLASNSIVALINLDIMIRFEHAPVEAHFQRYPNHFLCLSRFEYNPETGAVSLNEALEKHLYMNAQDAWVFRTPTPPLPLADIPVGNCPGCDNAIAFRAAEGGLIPINLATTFPIWHYDFVRQKDLDTQMVRDGATQLLHPEKYGRLFLPRIAVNGSLNYNLILRQAKEAPLRSIEETQPTFAADAMMSNFLACSLVVRHIPIPWDVKYLFGCIALNNSLSLSNAPRNS